MTTYTNAEAVTFLQGNNLWSYFFADETVEDMDGLELEVRTDRHNGVAVIVRENGQFLMGAAGSIGGRVYLGTDNEITFNKNVSPSLNA